MIRRPPRRAAATPVTDLALLLMLGLVLALAACGGATADGAGTASPPVDQPRQGGTLTLSFSSEPTSLDPAVADDEAARRVAHDIYQGLVQYAPEPGSAGTELVPCLATEVPSVENGGLSVDGRTLTFHLREGIRFQPPLSRELTADDVKYSLERMMRTRRAPAAPLFSAVVGADRFAEGRADEISGCEVVDERTLRIRLRQPDVSFLNALAMPCCAVQPREWVERWGGELGRHPLGTGPFVLQKWTRGQEIVLTRNPDYWEAGMPYLDGVSYRVSLDPTDALLRLERGEVDVLGDGVPAAEIARVTADPQLGGLVRAQPELAAVYLYMDVRTGPFRDAKVRRALSWAIDRDKLAGLQAGAAVPLWQFYPVGMPGHEEGGSCYGYDPKRARRLLAEAGYPDGFRAVLSTDDAGSDRRLWRSVQADLAAVGVRTRLRGLGEARDVAPRAKSGTPAAGSLRWRMDFPDPSDCVGPLFSKAGAVRDGTNPSFWWSRWLERMYARAQATADPAARLTMYVEMQDRLARQAPYVACLQPVYTTMCSRSTGGFYLHPVYRTDPARYWKK